MAATTAKNELKIKRVDQRVAPGFEQLERKIGPTIYWSAPFGHL